MELQSIEDDFEYECPNPHEKSTIIFKVEYVDGKDWGVMEYQYEGGAASYEEEFGCGLDYLIKEMVYPKEVELVEDNWYVIEGFYSSYYQYYCGEVDCDFYCENVRPASVYDLLYFGIPISP